MVCGRREVGRVYVEGQRVGWGIREPSASGNSRGDLGMSGGDSGWVWVLADKGGDRERGNGWG